MQTEFTIIIDTAEQAPFEFKNIKSDAKTKHKIYQVPTRRLALGRHPHSLGDYTTDLYFGECNVERKSVADCQSTILGWTTPSEKAKGLIGRRERFEKELENLSCIPCGLIVVEGSFGECIRTMPSYGRKTEKENAKLFARMLTRFQQRYSVSWMFCDTVRLAELYTFNWFNRYHRKHKNDGKV